MLITNDLARLGSPIAAFCRLVIVASAYVSMDWFRWDVGYKPTSSTSATTMSTEPLALRWVGPKKSEEKQ